MKTLKESILNPDFDYKQFDKIRFKDSNKLVKYLTAVDWEKYADRRNNLVGIRTKEQIMDLICGWIDGHATEAQDDKNIAVYMVGNCNYRLHKINKRINPWETECTIYWVSGKQIINQNKYSVICKSDRKMDDIWNGPSKNIIGYLPRAVTDLLDVFIDS